MGLDYIPEMEVADGIQTNSRPGVPSSYDLLQLFSTEFKTKQWVRDLADSVSNLMYEEIEMQRKALAMSRTPENVSRLFKLQMSKMLGFEYQSDSLTDADLDRILNFLSLYNCESKGPEHFIKFLGFVKDAELKMHYLWTRDYKDFQIILNNSQRSLYSGEGDFYQSTHVGLTYDIYATEQNLDTRDIEPLFYQIAPINLVLKWIAGLITISLPDIYLRMGFLTEEYVTLNARQVHLLELILFQVVVHREYIALSATA